MHWTSGAPLLIRSNDTYLTAENKNRLDGGQPKKFRFLQQPFAAVMTNL